MDELVEELIEHRPATKPEECPFRPDRTGGALPFRNTTPGTTHSTETMIDSRYASLLLITLCWFSLTGCGDEDGKPASGEPTGSPLSHLRDSSSYATLEPNRASLQYGYGSAEELIDALLAATARLDTTTLADLAISAEEWKEILYPEMGLHYPGARDSRPEIRDMIGELHFGASLKGLRRLLRDYGGRRLQRRSLEFTGDTLRFPSYTIYEGPDLRVSGPDGEGRVTSVGSIVEKNGVWKLLSFRETDASEGVPPAGDRSE